MAGRETIETIISNIAAKDREQAEQVYFLLEEIVKGRIPTEKIATLIKQAREDYAKEYINTEYLRQEAYLYWEVIFNNGKEKGQPRQHVGVPPCPDITKEQAKAFRQYGVECVYLPPQIPQGRWFLKPVPAMNDELVHKVIARAESEKEGKWIAVDTTQRAYQPGEAYGGGQDTLLRHLAGTTRFGCSWDYVTSEIMPHVARLLYADARAVFHLNLREETIVAGFCAFKKDIKESYPSWIEKNIDPRLAPVPADQPLYLGSSDLFGVMPPDLYLPKTFEWIAEHTPRFALNIGYTGVGSPPQVGVNQRSMKDKSLGFRPKVDLGKLAICNGEAQARRITQGIRLG